MKEKFKELAKYRIEKAKATLGDAEKYLAEATAPSTVNRIYYAIFYAVSGLLIAKGLSSSKHSGIRGFFNKEFVKKGLIDLKWGKFYSEMFDNRQEGDYQDFVEFKKEDVAEWLKKAKEFIGIIEKLTLKMGLL